MQNPFKDFFYFSRGERRGILVLVAGIVFIVLSGYVYPYWRERQPLPAEAKERQAVATAEYEAFMASVQQKEQRRERKFPAYSKYSKKEATVATLAPFNPNTADSITLCKLGLPGWMAKNIQHYRSRGGKFRKAEDFRKIYGLTEEQYGTLLPYIYIAPEDTARMTTRLYNPPSAADSTQLPEPIVYKYPAGTVVDLNLADTTELKKIPGIGSGIARLIAGYRQRLGGFYSIEQLQEINLDYRQLLPWLRIDSTAIQPINLNRAGIERLRNHPYINFYQAKVFVEYRKKKGTIRNLKPFSLYEEFTEEDLERIGHYVCFEQ